MNNLDDMLLFAQVVKLKSFRAAAEQRGVASSVVSKHISRLEQHLGVQLLIRTTRKLNLTEAGEEFFQHCQQLESGVALAERAVSQHAEQTRGVLRIAAPMISGQFFLPAVIDRYRVTLSCLGPLFSRGSPGGYLFTILVGCQLPE